MIKVVCTILAIAIKDPEMRLGNLNLPLRKSVIWFETGKQTVGILYYQY